MRIGPLRNLRKAIKAHHHVERAFTQAVSYYRYRSITHYRVVIAAYRGYVLRRRTMQRGA